MMDVVVHCFISLSIILIPSFIVNGAEIQISTANNRQYTMLSSFGITATNRLIRFKVKACKNAYVGLIFGIPYDDKIYEIGFGGESNTYSFIRVGQVRNAPKLDNVTGSHMVCYNYVEFWISWDDNTINIGQGLDVTGDLFLTWNSGTTLQTISRIGIATAWATGEWIFYTQEETSTTEGQTTECITTDGQTTEGTTTEDTTTEDTTTDGQTTEGQTTDGQTTEGQTSEGQTTEGQTSEGQTTDGQTTDGTTTEGTTTENTTTEGLTTEGHTTEGQTTEGQTTEGQTSEGQTTEGQTSEGKTTEGQTIEGKTTDGQTSEGKTTEGQTSEGQTTDGQTTEGQTTENTTNDGTTTGTTQDNDTTTEDTPSLDNTNKGTPVDGTTTDVRNTDVQSTKGTTTEGTRTEVSITEGATANSSTNDFQTTKQSGHIFLPTSYGKSLAEVILCTEYCTNSYTCNCEECLGTTTSSKPVTQYKVDKKTLSAYKRRYQSASDPRKSSLYIGCVGITVLVISCAFIVILDFVPRA